jgi:pimeloyl-ACP methyl ester carboxylesterase
VSLQAVDVGGQVVYEDLGGAGPPMVLVHGLGGSKENWMLVARPLAERGYRVLAPDLAGFGATPLDGRESDLETNRRIVDALIAGGTGPAVLVGHSMGGLVAMMQAASNPDSVARLVLLDPAVPLAKTSPMKPLPTALVNLLARRPGIGAAAAGAIARLEGPQNLVNNVMRQYCFDSARLDPALVEALVAGERARIARGDPYLGYMQAYRSMRACLDDPDSYERDIAKRVAAPTLLVAGAADVLVPTRFIRRLAALRADWTYYEMEEVGHNPQMEAPARLVELVLSWLGAPTPAR